MAGFLLLVIIVNTSCPIGHYLLTRSLDEVGSDSALFDYCGTFFYNETIMREFIRFPFPVFIAKEGRWFVSECPVLSIATQGRTEKEVKENMKDLIAEYLKAPDTAKISLDDLGFSSFTYISALMPKRFLYGKTQAAVSK